MRTMPCPHEDEEQKTIMEWVSYAKRTEPALGLLYAIPNGGKRDAVTAARMKQTGTRAGVPDLCLPVARGGYHALYIELKRMFGGKVSAEQKQWIERLNEEGCYAVVCKGSAEAITCLIQYIKGKIVKEGQNANN